MNETRLRPFSIRIFLPDGTPEGLRIIEKSNWTGIGLVVPRSLFPEAKKRDEFSRTGVYVLVGSDDETELPILYIGQGDPVRSRLEQHFAQKDFWTWAVCFVTRDNSLNKAYVGYLESRLIKLARETKRTRLDNQNIPLPSPLTEADAADMESFLADMLSIFPLVGLTAFEKPREAPTRRSLFYLNSTKGAHAQGYESPLGFVVQAGSTAVPIIAGSIHPYQVALREQLIEQGVLVEDGELLRFTQDYAFGSPSIAAAVIMGRTASGPANWRDETGRSLKDIREAEESEDRPSG